MVETLMSKEYEGIIDATDNRSLRRRVLYNLETTYLITKSDIKTTVFPATTFALAAILSGSLLTTNGSPCLNAVVFRLPFSILWTWSNLWLFNLANQRLPSSILEDLINKPWRAIPSGRLSAITARYLLLCSLPLVFLLTFFLGGRDESIFLMVLTWIYNDLGAADENFFVRHLNNALGFVTFAAGATQALAGQNEMNATAYQWLAVIAAVITFTIQFQDMEDQEGDHERGRKTLPIVFGDEQTRIVNAVVILACSFAAARFWDLNWWGYAMPVGLGLIIAARTLCLKVVQEDRRTFKLWCLWLVGLYLLPMFSSPWGYEIAMICCALTAFPIVLVEVKGRYHHAQRTISLYLQV